MESSESLRRMGIEPYPNNLLTNDMKINNAMLCIRYKNKTARDFLMCLSTLVTIYCDNICIDVAPVENNKSRIIVDYKSSCRASQPMSYSEAIMDIRKYIRKVNNYIDITITNISDNINVFRVYVFEAMIAKVEINDNIDNLCFY